MLRLSSGKIERALKVQVQEQKPSISSSHQEFMMTRPGLMCKLCSITSRSLCHTQQIRDTSLTCSSIRVCPRIRYTST